MRPRYRRRAEREWKRAKKLMGRICDGLDDFSITWRVWYRPLLGWLWQDWRNERRANGRGMGGRR